MPKGKQSTKPQVGRSGQGPNSQRLQQTKRNQSGSKLESAPVSQSRLQRIGSPQFSSPNNKMGDGRIRIKHREYIKDVSGSVAFGNSVLSVNPGLSSAFPWLSQIANNYESYEFHSLNFEYETLAATSKAGKVMMAIDYDASDSAPVNKTDILSTHDAVDCAAWQCVKYSSSRQDLKKFGSQRFVRSGNVANTDIKTYDVGNLNVATQGMSDTTAVGELYVVYDIELMTPQKQESFLSAEVSGANAISKSQVFGTAPTQAGTLPLTIGLNTLTFGSVGQWLVELQSTGTGMVAPTITGTATTSAALASVINAGTTVEVQSFTVKANNVGDTFIVDYTGSTTVVSMFARLGLYTASNN